jgi:hypothetical protein
MRGVLGKAGWRWLFLIEYVCLALTRCCSGELMYDSRGLITLSIGLATFFRMPPSPTQTKAWHRPNGWFTEREEVICVNRILRDDPSKVSPPPIHTTLHVHLTIRGTCTTAKDCPSSACGRLSATTTCGRSICCELRLYEDFSLAHTRSSGLVFGLPVGPPSAYLTLSLRHLGFDTFQTNLLTIPSTVLGIFTMLGITIISEVINDRALVSMAEDVWALPFLIALYKLSADTNPWVYYGIVTALLSYPCVVSPRVLGCKFMRTARYTHPIQVGWASRNSGAVASRTVNASLYNMFVTSLPPRGFVAERCSGLCNSAPSSLPIFIALVMLLFVSIIHPADNRNAERISQTETVTVPSSSSRV